MRVMIEWKLRHWKMDFSEGKGLAAADPERRIMSSLPHAFMVSRPRQPKDAGESSLRLRDQIGFVDPVKSLDTQVPCLSVYKAETPQWMYRKVPGYLIQRLW